MPPPQRPRLGAARSHPPPPRPPPGGACHPAGTVEAVGSPFGGGGGNSVTVTIGGNAVQLQTAAQQASAALGNVGSAAQSAANTTGSAMRTAAAGFDQLTQSIKYLQQAQVALGASQVQGDAAFLNEAKTAQDYSARLQVLSSYLQLFNAQQQQTASTAQQTGASLDFNVFG